MNKYLPYLNTSLSFQNLDQKVKLIDFNDSVMNFDEKHIGDKLIKFFLFLYLFEKDINQDQAWNSIYTWGPAALLPIFNLLGTIYTHKTISSLIKGEHYDVFTKVAFTFPHAVASLKVGQGVKSEGELVISGTKGYAYVPAPWWKTDYFELRYENPADNKRYFYPLDGEGIRNELVVFSEVSNIW